MAAAIPAMARSVFFPYLRHFSAVELDFLTGSCILCFARPVFRNRMVL